MPSAPTQSKALELNLRRTAVAVVIPRDQQVLLEIIGQLRGLHHDTQRLLREINHRYVGWSRTLDDLHQRAMSDFAYYDTHPRGPDAIAVQERAIRYWLYYMEKVVTAGRAIERNAPPLCDALVRLGAIFDPPR